MTKSKKNGMLIFVIAMLVFHGSQVYLPPIPLFLDKTVLSIAGIGSYFIFAYIAHRLDTKD